jgi:hypothetical protein
MNSSLSLLYDNNFFLSLKNVLKKKKIKSFKRKKFFRSNSKLKFDKYSTFNLMNNIITDEDKYVAKIIYSMAKKIKKKKQNMNTKNIYG